MFLAYGAAPEISIDFTTSGYGENSYKNAQVHWKMVFVYRSFRNHAWNISKTSRIIFEGLMPKGNPVIIKSGSYLEPKKLPFSQRIIFVYKMTFQQKIYIFWCKSWINFWFVLEFVAFRVNLINILVNLFLQVFERVIQWVWLYNIIKVHCFFPNA